MLLDTGFIHLLPNMQARNIKTGDIYHILGTAINVTNSEDGTVMVVYERENNMFVRELHEFVIKFEILQ